MRNSDFMAALRRVQVVRHLSDEYAQVNGWIRDGRYDEAIEALEGEEGLLARTDAVGDDFTLSHWPFCPPCGSTGEIPGNPNLLERATRCVDAPSRCVGNRYGRMHPTQLLDYAKAQRANRSERQEADAEAARIARELPPPPPGNEYDVAGGPRPTPPPES